MNRKMLLVLPLMAVLLGCQQRVKAPNYGRSDAYPQGPISFSDDDLESRTAIGEINAYRPADTNLLTVTVAVRAATNKRLFVQYRGVFRDEGGREIDRTAWMNKTLEPNAFDEIQITSSDPRAERFRVDFRYARTDP